MMMMMMYVGQAWLRGAGVGRGGLNEGKGGRMRAGRVIGAIIKYKECLELIISLDDDADDVCCSSMVEGGLGLEGWSE